MHPSHQERAYWAAEHKKWRESGEEQETYCKNKGLIFKQFKSGVKKASAAGLLCKKARPMLKEKPPEGRAGFKRIEIEQKEAIENSGAYCEIWFEGRLGIRVEKQESLSQLGELIKGLMR